MFKVFLNDVKKIFVTYKTEDVNAVAKISEIEYTGVFTARRIFWKCGLSKSFARRVA